MGRLALVIALAAFFGCISKAKEAIAPAPDGTGTLSCRDIVEQCDSQCGDPICLNGCSNQGTQEGAGQHAALLDCGQRNGCTDQACMEKSCPSEISACMGPNTGTPADTAAPATEPSGTQGGPGQAPPS